MAVFIPFASGKGGVGKTVSTIHTAIELSRLGKTVILIDGDMGSSNVHAILGIKNKNPGLGSIIHRQERHIEDLILATRFDKLFFIPGDGQFSGTANPPTWFRRRLAREIPALVADFVLMDLGAGTSTFVLDMFLLSKVGMLVTTPELPALLNAYGFVKNACLRIFQQHTKRRSPEGEISYGLGSLVLDSTGSDSLKNILLSISTANPESAERIRADLDSFKPQIILTMGTDESDLRLGANLKKTSMSHLGVEAQYLGFIPWHADMRTFMNSQQVLQDLQEDSPARIAYHRLAAKLLSYEHAGTGRIQPPDETDLVAGLL